MKTPAEHLTAAEELLEKADRVLAMQRDVPVDILVKVANARVTLALAINAIPLLGDLGDELRELRHPYKKSNYDAIYKEVLGDK